MADVAIQTIQEAGVHPVVPATPQMETKPARVIGDQVERKFTGMDDVRLAITALFGIVAGLGVQVAPGLEQNVQNLVTAMVPLLVVMYARYATERTKTRQAQEQAERTRDAVYSPAAVDRIIDTAATQAA